MAGMLPGVECARRRKIHQSGLLDSSSSITSTTSFGHSSRRSSSFGLYQLYAPITHEIPHLSMQKKQNVRHIDFDEKLDETTREAKKRLDEKLNALSKSQKTRGSKKCQQTLTEVSRPTKAVSKRFSWVAKLRLNFSEGECVVCLDTFKAREGLMELPCNHRFHSSCVLPWLATNAHCPCCRLQISVQ